MKKVFFLFSILVSAFLLYNVMYASSSLRFKYVAPEGGKCKVTLEMLNCKPGFYKTYEDFVNQTPKNWTFKSLGWVTVGNKLKKYDIIFLDESGKEVDVPTTDFWGWKAQKGQLYRNMSFVNGKVEAIAVEVEYTSKDYVVYKIPPMGNVEIRPGRWFSFGLNDELLAMDVFLKQHPDIATAYKKTQADLDKCNTPSRRFASIKEWDDERISRIIQLDYITGYFTLFGEKNKPGSYIK